MIKNTVRKIMSSNVTYLVYGNTLYLIVRAVKPYREVMRIYPNGKILVRPIDCYYWRELHNCTVLSCFMEHLV